MHTSDTSTQWTRHLHDGRVRVVHHAMHLLHEKSFWGILSLVVLLAGLLVLVAMLGGDVAVESFNMPYGPYY